MERHLLVCYVHELVCHDISLIVRQDRVVSQRVCARLGEACDNIPGAAASRDVVQGRVLPREHIRVRVCGRLCDSECDVLGHSGHGGHHEKGVQVRDLMCGTEHGVEAATIDIEADIPVGKEDGRDLATLSELGELGIVRELILCSRVILWASSDLTLVHFPHMTCKYVRCAGSSVKFLTSIVQNSCSLPQRRSPRSKAGSALEPLYDS